MQITASVANLEQESKELLPAMSPSRVWEGLVQSSKVSNLEVHRMASVGKRKKQAKLNITHFTRIYYGFPRK